MFKYFIKRLIYFKNNLTWLAADRQKIAKNLKASFGKKYMISFSQMRKMEIKYLSSFLQKQSIKNCKIL